MKIVLFLFSLFIVALFSTNTFAAELPKTFILDFSVKHNEKNELVIEGKTNLPDGLEVVLDIEGGKEFGSDYSDFATPKVSNGKFISAQRTFPMKYLITVRYGGMGSSWNMDANLFGEHFEALRRSVKDGKVTRDKYGYYLISTSKAFRVGTKAEEKSLLQNSFKSLKNRFDVIRDLHKKLDDNLDYLISTGDQRGYGFKKMQWRKDFRAAKKKYQPLSIMSFYERLSIALSSGWTELDLMPVWMASGNIVAFQTGGEEFVEAMEKAEAEIKRIKGKFR